MKTFSDFLTELASKSSLDKIQRHYADLAADALEKKSGEAKAHIERSWRANLLAMKRDTNKAKKLKHAPHTYNKVKSLAVAEGEDKEHYVVKAKSPFWKKEHYVQAIPGAHVMKRHIKHATKHTHAEATKIAKQVSGGPNKWEVEVIKHPDIKEETFSEMFGLKKCSKAKISPDRMRLATFSKSDKKDAKDWNGRHALGERLPRKEEVELEETHIGFDKLAKKVHSKALAAWIGRKKYGKKSFQKHAAEGKPE